MAKKKVAPHEKEPKEDNIIAPQVEAKGTNRGHDAHSEKIQSLKNLNSMLLKETAERRRQVETLEWRREELEKEARRLAVVRKALESELSRECEERVEMALERSVLSCFFEAWRGEVEGEVRRSVAERDGEVRALGERLRELARVVEGERVRVSVVVEERDLLLEERGGLVERVEYLKEELKEVERVRRGLEESLEMERMENEKLRREKVEGERMLKGLVKEKEAVEEELMMVGKEVGGLRGEIEELVKAKEEIDREKNNKEIEIGQLEKEVARLNEVEMNSQKEEEKLRSRLFELERACDAALEKEKEREREINALNEEEEVKGAKILDLKGVCDSLEKMLRLAEKELKEKERLVEEMEKKRIEIEELNDCNHNEIARLKREAAKSEDVITGLESSCCDLEDKNKALLAEVSFCKKAFDRIEGEKRELEKLLAEEKENVITFASKLSEMEKKIEVTKNESRVVQDERDGLIMEKTFVEKKLNSSVEEKEMLEKRLSGAEQSIDDLKAKIELAGIKSEQIFGILKRNVASLVKENGGEEDSTEEQKIDEDFQAYVKELDAIKSAFRNKECVMEELKQQLEDFKESAARAQKEKGFWTLLSSATALFAAASVAYLARGR